MSKHLAGGYRIPLVLVGGSVVLGATLGVLGCGAVMVGNWLVERAGRALETEVEGA